MVYFIYLNRTKLTNFALFLISAKCKLFQKLFVYLFVYHVCEIYGRGRLQVLRHEDGNKWVRSHVQRNHRPQRIRLQFLPFLSNIVQAVVCFWLRKMRILISIVDQYRYFLGLVGSGSEPTKIFFRFRLLCVFNYSI